MAKRKPPRLYLRSNGYWVILENGKETSTGTIDRLEAEAALALHTTQTLDRIVSDYCDFRIKRVASKGFIICTARPICEWWKGKTILDINSAHCQAYMDWRQKSASYATARHDLKTLRAAINWYHRDHPMPYIPKVTIPQEPPQKESYFLTRKQVAERLRVAIRYKRYQHIARALLIGVYTGTRIGALSRMRWVKSDMDGWFDLDNGIMYRAGPKKELTKKQQTKARIHEALMPHLRRWHKQDSLSGIEWCIHYAGKPVRDIRCGWRAVARKAGHDDDGPHICRHTAVTWLLRSGVSYYETSRYVGATARTIERVYSHHSPEFQLAASRARGK